MKTDIYNTFSNSITTHSCKISQNNNEELNNEDEIQRINILNNKVVGDGISGIFCVLYFLKQLNISYKDWFHLVIKNNNLLYKKEVNDKSIFKTNEVGDRLIEPIEIQNQFKD